MHSFSFYSFRKVLFREKALKFLKLFDAKIFAPKWFESKFTWMTIKNRLENEIKIKIEK
jgi:hypothetical protein